VKAHRSTTVGCRNLLNLRLLFKNQKKLTLSFVFKWLDISELKMPKLVDLCVMVGDKGSHIGEEQPADIRT
jgi:hypothetical protein